MKEITGNTRILGILADPIHHVKTPQLLNRLLFDHQIDGVMVPIHVPPARLSVAFEGLRNMSNLNGLVITVPHKTAVMALCDQVTEAAASIGAVNVVRRERDGAMVGDMLDGEGFVEGLQALDYRLKGKRVYLAGAGGAANAIAFALAKSGISHLTVANRTSSRVDDLLSRLKRCYPDLDTRHGSADPSDHELVINATSLGLREADALPVDTTKLHAGQMVADIIMEPAETALLKAARIQGCTAYPGAGMLAGQVRRMMEFLCAGEPSVLAKSPTAATL
ncbi:MAG: shikimate dehydrogenase [Pusillimonas sp.]